jgi:hypothetical protein
MSRLEDGSAILSFCCALGEQLLNAALSEVGIFRLGDSVLASC